MSFKRYYSYIYMGNLNKNELKDYLHFLKERLFNINYVFKIFGFTFHLKYYPNYIGFNSFNKSDKSFLFIIHKYRERKYTEKPLNKVYDKKYKVLNQVLNIYSDNNQKSFEYAWKK